MELLVFLSDIRFFSKTFLGKKKWSEGSFRSLLVPSYQLDIMWSPSRRLLSLVSPFPHSWNRTGSEMLTEWLGCTLHQREKNHVGFPGEGWLIHTCVQTDVGLFIRSPVKVIVPHFKFSTSQSSYFIPTAAAVWLLSPHNLPPAVSGWSFLATGSLSTLAWSGYNNSMALCWYQSEQKSLNASSLGVTPRSLENIWGWQFPHSKPTFLSNCISSPSKAEIRWKTRPHQNP